VLSLLLNFKNQFYNSFSAANFTSNTGGKGRNDSKQYKFFHLPHEKKWISHLKVSQKKFIWLFEKFMLAQNLPLKFTPVVVLSSSTHGRLNMLRHC